MLLTGLLLITFTRVCFKDDRSEARAQSHYIVLRLFDEAAVRMDAQAKILVAPARSQPYLIPE
ncbi:hypothetical protein [Candidatus Nitrotoga arctica]|uniref:Uncharacterized protein n=1 Tax=Candidatus Nitrotoga arctica TaxID=453162 RepID=A0ABM8Z071_9PROT|nr:hypothetical protein [Candidatus Nitrotoga arctica]CAG9933247.1 protein of unknown function [Candidatus Nitrotoga arctica]